MSKSILRSALFVCLFFPLAASAASTTFGKISTSSGAAISQTQLKNWIDEFSPDVSDRLIVLTECYGGNVATEFAGKANTAVASATKPGQLARYGRYDKGAAAALKPGSGTGQTVHDAGIATKSTLEDPTTGGGMALSDFSLQNTSTSASAAVRSRHVLVYAGQPDGNPPNKDDDVKLRNTIEDNFLGNVSTTVHTVGGPGGGGWGQPGTMKGLRKELSDIKLQFDVAPDKSKEQFILFVTDHGIDNKGDQPTSTGTGTTGSGTNVTTVTNFDTFIEGTDVIASDLLLEPDNEPGFSVFIPFDENASLVGGVPQDYASLQGLFAPGTFQLNTGLDVFTDFEVVFSDFEDNGFVDFIGDVPGEGVEIFFPVDEGVFVNNYFDTTLSVATITNTLGSLYMSDFTQTTGNMSKLSTASTVVPIPAAIWLFSSGFLALVGVMRRGRLH